MKTKKIQRKGNKASNTRSKKGKRAGDMRAAEKALSDLTAILNEQQFGSVEEAKSFLHDLLTTGELPPAENATALQKAQELVYEAFEASGKKLVELARQALEICPDCADAYVLLAEEAAQTLEEQKNLFEQGVLAGERALGPKMFKNEVGNFWGILETRPYMRARAGLAQCLWLLSSRKEALDHYRDLLRLNPNDNQGIRYLLANCLLAEALDQELENLLHTYEDDRSATWLYSRALLLFRKDGNSQRARAALQEAKAYNRFVPLFLLGKKRLPRYLPDYIGMGDENEAVEYAALALELWQQTPGALTWLSDTAPGDPYMA